MSSREHHLGDRTSINGHGNGRYPRVASKRVLDFGQCGDARASFRGRCAAARPLRYREARHGRRAGARYARRLAFGKNVAARNVGGSSRQCRRGFRPLCRVDRGGASGQPTDRCARPIAQPDPGEGRRYRPRHHRCQRRRDRVFADAGFPVHRYPRRVAPAAIAAADVADLSVLPGLLAGDPDRGADHLPDRCHHRAAGHLPFPQIRRGFLRRRHGRHIGAARTRRPDRRYHGRRPFRQRLHRRAWLDEDARGNRRAVHHGAGSARS
jgi:hypothetical protein